MQRDEVLTLLSPEGLALLASLPEYRGADDVLKTVTSLRAAGHSPALVAAVMNQSRLRRRAEAKFGPFAETMLFTEAGLEQATRFAVAARHAARFRDAGLQHVADLGCGIGGDALALSALGLRVDAVERDEATAAIAAFNLAAFDTAQVHHADVTDYPLGEADSVWLDPARRSTAGGRTRRLHDPNEYSPSLNFAFELAVRMPAGIKLAPALDRDLIPHWAEAQWVSDRGEVVELALWSGPLARDGIRRSALVIRQDGAAAELAADGDAPDVPVSPLGDYLYEPDGAVIRARLIGLLAEHLGDARMISGAIAYLSSDVAIDSPFATCFRVRETMPLDTAKIAKRLRELGIGSLEIKKRGTDHDPATLRKALKLQGDESATLFLTRIDGRHRAILADRMEFPPAQ